MHNQLEKKTKECEDSHKMYEEEFDKKMHGEGSNSNDDDNGNEKDSDQEEEQKKKKKKRKVTPKVIAQQELPPDAKEAFGDGKNKFGKYNKGKDGKGKEGKGNDFKVGTVNMAHDHGMRYKLDKMVTKRRQVERLGPRRVMVPAQDEGCVGVHERGGIRQAQEGAD